MSKSFVKPVLLTSIFLSTLLSSTLQADTISIEAANNIPAILSSPPPLPPIPAEYMPMRSAESLQSAFKKMDKNHDERISFEEQISYRQAQKEKRKEEEFKRIIKDCDKDKNGIISDKEFSAEQAIFGMMPTEPPKASLCMLPPFARDIMDFNEDGILTIEEVKRAVMSDKPPTPKAKQKMKNKLQQMEVKQKTKQFDKCDVNQDQLLSLREAFSVNCQITHSTEDYDAHDTNLDNYLSVAEISKKVKSVMPENDLPPEVLKGMSPLDRLEMSFFQCDKNSDERLDKDETLSTRCNVDPQLFDKVDHNQDNAIEQTEMRQLRIKQSFDRNDKNSNGFLDKSEFKHEMIW